MRIAFFETEACEDDFIRRELSAHDLLLSPDKLAALTLPLDNDFEAISVFVNSRLDKQVLDYFPRLKFIATRSTGYDHIDLPTCRARGIAVAYVPGYGDNTVAEFTFGLILNLTRKIYSSVDQIKETGSFSLAGLRGMDLVGKTLGVIGTGRIGKEVIRIGRGFDMRIIAHDPYPDEQFAALNSVEYLPLENLLRRADVVTLHCPYNPSTHHLINQQNINFIKKGAYLVNTARGAIVETQALVNALSNGTLAGVGLDVLEEEGETKDELNLLRDGHPQEEKLRIVLQNHLLMRMPNVLVTPHNAFNSQEALQRILDTSVANIRGYLAGQPVNLAK